MRAGVCVRLVDSDDATTGERLPRGVQHRRDLFRMVRVVVDDLDAVHGALALEPAADTLVFAKRLDRLTDVESERIEGCEGGGRVPGIVPPWNGKRHAVRVPTWIRDHPAAGGALQHPVLIAALAEGA